MSVCQFLLTLMMSMSGVGEAWEGEGEEQRVVTVRVELTSPTVKLLRLSSTACSRRWWEHWLLEHWSTPRLGMGKSGQLFLAWLVSGAGRDWARPRTGYYLIRVDWLLHSPPALTPSM